MSETRQTNTHSEPQEDRPERGSATVAISLRVPPTLKTCAEKAARNDHRSLSSLIEIALVKYLEDAGYLSRI